MVADSALYTENNLKLMKEEKHSMDKSSPIFYKESQKFS